jgi:hypothetical protein
MASLKSTNLLDPSRLLGNPGGGGNGGGGGGGGGDGDAGGDGGTPPVGLPYGELGDNLAVLPEILVARRAFPEAQGLLQAIPTRRAGGAVSVGWHDQTLDIESPAFAVVRPGGPHGDLVGEVLRVTRNNAEVFVYVHRSAGVTADLSLCRRAFHELGALWESTMTCVVEVI